MKDKRHRNEREDRYLDIDRERERNRGRFKREIETHWDRPADRQTYRDRRIKIERGIESERERERET